MPPTPRSPAPIADLIHREGTFGPDDAAATRVEEIKDFFDFPDLFGRDSWPFVLLIVEGGVGQPGL